MHVVYRLCVHTACDVTSSIASKLSKEKKRPVDAHDFAPEVNKNPVCPSTALGVNAVVEMGLR